MISFCRSDIFVLVFQRGESRVSFARVVARGLRWAASHSHTSVHQLLLSSLLQPDTACNSDKESIKRGTSLH